MRVLEELATGSQPISLGTLAGRLSAPKPTVYRHLQTLVRHGFARQDASTGRYDVGIRLLVLGEASRDRFDVARAARSALMRLRDDTQQAVTLCSLIENELVVLDLIQGQTVVEFGTRPGTRMDVHASAHGKTWLAFGPPDLIERVLAGPRKAWTPRTIVDGATLRREVERVRARGWATAPDEVITGVNALAAPVFDHRGAMVGSLAIVGATQFIAAEPAAEQVEALIGTAREVSRTLGWRG